MLTLKYIFILRKITIINKKYTNNNICIHKCQSMCLRMIHYYNRSNLKFLGNYTTIYIRKMITGVTLSMASQLWQLMKRHSVKIKMFRSKLTFVVFCMFYIKFIKLHIHTNSSPEQMFRHFLASWTHKPFTGLDLNISE